MNNKSKSYRLSIRGILIAIIFLQSMVPFLGYIPVLLQSFKSTIK